MTMGQRIAQKRKDLGLSQEALGERLGVSRQAIYKWESDAALPEIEKLVNLSREFGVSVGWLLGEEDETQERPELTPEQLRMVEEIVGRYLDARPGTEPPAEGEAEKHAEPECPQKRRWPRVLGWAAVIAAVLLISSLFTRLEQMRQENQNLQMSVAEIRYDVNRQINGIAGRVEDILQSQNTLTAEQSAKISDTDYRANTITVSARALPRTYVEGMAAEFILVSGGETVTVPGELGDSHTFTAKLTGPLSDSITVSVVFLTGDQRQTQLLKQFSDLYSVSFPDVWIIGGDLVGSGAQIREYAYVRVNEKEADRIAGIRLGLFRDKELLVWYEHLDEQPPPHSGGWPADTEFFRLDGEWMMEPGHVYCQAAVVVDEYGRERVYPSMPPVIYDGEKGGASYIDSKEYSYYWSSNPAGWDY